jgi:hypothetical protein
MDGIGQSQSCSQQQAIEFVFVTFYVRMVARVRTRGVAGAISSRFMIIALHRDRYSSLSSPDRLASPSLSELQTCPPSSHFTANMEQDRSSFRMLFQNHRHALSDVITKHATRQLRLILPRPDAMVLTRLFRHAQRRFEP